MSVASRSRAMRSVMSSMCGGSVTVYQRRLCLNTTWALSVLGEARMPTAPSRRSEGMESNVFPLNVQSICSFFLCCGAALFSHFRLVVFVRPCSRSMGG